MKFHNGHLAYCTNVHPAETWEETFHALKVHTLKVRDKLLNKIGNKHYDKKDKNTAYAIGLRLSAIAAEELLYDDHLDIFKQWLADENCYVFTLNGFPYGAFHGTEVKESVYLPDWTSQDRLSYTKNLFNIIAQLVPDGVQGSVSTLPASFKEFRADEATIFDNLIECAHYIEALSQKYNRDLHLGMEPEPLGHFENTEETLAFFNRFLANFPDTDSEFILKRIGINYDTCHFALEFDDCYTSLRKFQDAGVRISKVHLSSAIALDLTLPDAVNSLHRFNEPTYLHQVITRNNDGELTRYKDLPDFLTTQPPPQHTPSNLEARVHFHIPLYSQPEAPLGSTQQHVESTLRYLRENSNFCQHFEIETYTWAALPEGLQIPIETQIAKEYEWVMNH